MADGIKLKVVSSSYTEPGDHAGLVYSNDHTSAVLRGRTITVVVGTGGQRVEVKVRLPKED